MAAVLVGLPWLGSMVLLCIEQSLLINLLSKIDQIFEKREKLISFTTVVRLLFQSSYVKNRKTKGGIRSN